MFIFESFIFRIEEPSLCPTQQTIHSASIILNNSLNFIAKKKPKISIHTMENKKIDDKGIFYLPTPIQLPLSTDKRQKIVIQKNEELSSTVITASVDRKYGFQKYGFGSEINDDTSSYFFDSVSTTNNSNNLNNATNLNDLKRKSVNGEFDGFQRNMVKSTNEISDCKTDEISTKIFAVENRQFDFQSVPNTKSISVFTIPLQQNTEKRIAVVEKSNSEVQKKIISGNVAKKMTYSKIPKNIPTEKIAVINLTRKMSSQQMEKSMRSEKEKEKEVEVESSMLDFLESTKQFGSSLLSRDSNSKRKKKEINDSRNNNKVNEDEYKSTINEKVNTNIKISESFDDFFYRDENLDDKYPLLNGTLILDGNNNSDGIILKSEKRTESSGYKEIVANFTDSDLHEFELLDAKTKLIVLETLRKDNEEIATEELNVVTVRFSRYLARFFCVLKCTYINFLRCNFYCLFYIHNTVQ